MKGRAFAFRTVYGFVISLFMAMVLSLASASINDVPITWVMFGLSTLQGTILGTVISVVVPLQKIGNALADGLHAETRLSRTLIMNVAVVTIFAVVMVFYFTAVNTGFVTFEAPDGPVTFGNRFMHGFEVIWSYIFVSVIIFDPIAFAAAHKATGFPPMEQGNKHQE